MTGNKNDDTAMPPEIKRMQCDYIKEHMQQRWQDPKYHMDEAKHIKEAKQERQQDPKNKTDETKQNKVAMQKKTRSSIPYTWSRMK